MSRAVAANKRAGEQVEVTVAAAVDGLQLVPDDVVVEYDAIATSAVFPSAALPMVGLCVVARGTLVEIKSTVRRLSDGQRGRLYFRPTQHETLVERGGVYLVAIRDGGGDLLAIKVVPAVIVDDLLPGWLDGGPGRSDYAQLSWGRLFRTAEVEERGRA